MSNETDIAVSSVGLPNLINTIKKPPHLILITNPAKNGKELCFLSVDKPEMIGNFVQAKGFFVDSSKEDISENFIQILSEQNKASYEELIFPQHRILVIKNLIFKAK